MKECVRKLGQRGGRGSLPHHTLPAGACRDVTQGYPRRRASAACWLFKIHSLRTLVPSQAACCVPCPALPLPPPPSLLSSCRQCSHRRGETFVKVATFRYCQVSDVTWKPVIKG
ncbi:uncharacterized protein LOC123518039 [Portunus trituberculatus]|uniref:uncharacterized protein LOC123518039 n=1 Tax=Portunus trituberculatus TaxID=210409 RepID=UPI001E1CB1BD|nr:uncharacterized protein LOC123518039 [Portunus trituberculatus]